MVEVAVDAVEDGGELVQAGVGLRAGRHLADVLHQDGVQTGQVLPQVALVCPNIQSCKQIH